jgi:hypothetical protein
MAQESIILESGTQQATSGQAGDVSRYSTAHRIVIASIWVAGGFLLAAPCIVIPIVHLFSTWGLPLLGILNGPAHVEAAGGHPPDPRSMPGMRPADRPQRRLN